MMAMRVLLMLALVIMALGTSAARAQLVEQNTKCDASCKTALDQCSAVSRKIMTVALKETTSYKIGTPQRQRADTKFENAFLAGEKCWDSYYRCAARCQPPRHCIDACQAKFAQCFAAGERLMRDGLQEMKGLKFNSPEWQAANAKGDAETDKCLEDNRSCQAKCANP
jgi:hypothetical protein